MTPKFKQKNRNLSQNCRETRIYGLLRERKGWKLSPSRDKIYMQSKVKRVSRKKKYKAEEIKVYFVKSVLIEEIGDTADYFITVDMDNINRPFGIKVQLRGGESEEARHAYTTAVEAYSAAVRFAENQVLPNTLRDIIRDELVSSIC